MLRICGSIPPPLPCISIVQRDNFIIQPRMEGKLRKEKVYKSMNRKYYVHGMNFLNKNCTELNTQTPNLEEEVASDSASISYKTFEQSVP
jgi:hypothetical protein